MVEPAGAPLLVNNPVVDEVIVLPRKQWLARLKQPWQWPGTIADACQFWSDVRHKGFDAAIDFQGLLKSAVSAAASGAQRRLGYARAREGSHFFLTDKHDAGDFFGPDVHVIDQQLRLAAFVCEQLVAAPATLPAVAGGSLTFPLPAVPESDRQRVDNLLNAGLASDSGDLAALIPGTTWPSKTWDTYKWIDLGRLMIEQLGINLVLVGGKAEESANQAIAAGIAEAGHGGRVVNLTGATNLLELLRVFERCKLVIGGDTGPLHLAAASAKPKVVGVYGSTPWRRNGPYGAQSHTVVLNLSCQPCFQQHCPLGTTACLVDMPAKRVFDELVSFSGATVR
jgi:lipopolysaccharide heptosyltransferase II